jgi:hypothetical protein
MEIVVPEPTRAKLLAYVILASALPLISRSNESKYFRRLDACCTLYESLDAVSVKAADLILDD